MAAKVALITGCSTGIGRAFALDLHSRGWQVWATARKPASVADLAAKGMRTCALDVNDAASITAAVAQVMAESGQIDLLINNAGFALFGPAIELPMAEVRRQFETNVFGPLNLIHAVAPSMAQRRGGVIANVGSVAGVAVTPFAGIYGASKAAMHGLDDALRLELAPFGVSVVTVQPGAIKSSIADNGSSHLERNIKADSLYAPISEAIYERAGISQEKTTSAADFARVVIDGLTQPKPPALIRYGVLSTQLPALKRWLPSRLSDRILSKRFGLLELNKKLKG